MKQVILVIILLFSFCCYGQELNHAKILAIGEASHGESKIYDFRYQILKSKIDQGKHVKILIEMPSEGGIAIHKYMNEKITKDSLFYYLGFYGLKTDAFLSFIDATKQFKDKISFVGIDMQEHFRLFTLIKQTYGLKIKNEILEKSVYSQYSNVFNKDSLKNLISTEYANFKSALNKELFFRNISIDIDLQIQLNQIEQALEYAYLISKNEEVKSSLYRDSCMFENSKNMIDFYYKTNDIMIFGANYHLSKMEKTCGWFLSQNYPNDYYVCGQQFLQGEILSVSFETGERTIKTATLRVFKKGFAYKLNQHNLNGFIDITKASASSEKIKKLLSKKQYFLDFGGYLNPVLKSNFILLIPNEVYDGIYFHYESKAS